MRVAWVSHSSDLGGAEICLREGVEALRRRGVDVHVILPSRGPLAEDLEGSGIPVYVTRYGWWVSTSLGLSFRLKRSAGQLVRSRKVARLIRQIGPDVVMSNTLAVVVGALAARRAGVPHVWFIHEFGERDHGLRFDLGARLSEHLIGWLSERVLVNSRSVLTSLAERIPREKLLHVSYAVQMPEDAIAGATAGVDTDLRLLLIGQKTPGKRQEDAVRAVALLKQWGVFVRLALVGREDPEYSRILRQLIQDLDLREEIEMVSFVRDPIDFFRRADVVVICSHAEAFGRVTVEAMKLGKPVVGADAAGTAELIRHGWNGLLYRPGDVEDLAAKLSFLHENRRLLRELGEQAGEWSRSTFTTELFGAGLLRALTEALEARSPTEPTPDSARGWV